MSLWLSQVIITYTTQIKIYYMHPFVEVKLEHMNGSLHLTTLPSDIPLNSLSNHKLELKPYYMHYFSDAIM